MAIGWNPAEGFGPEKQGEARFTDGKAVVIAASLTPGTFRSTGMGSLNWHASPEHRSIGLQYQPAQRVPLGGGAPQPLCWVEVSTGPDTAATRQLVQVGAVGLAIQGVAGLIRTSVVRDNGIAGVVVGRVAFATCVPFRTTSAHSLAFGATEDVPAPFGSALVTLFVPTGTVTINAGKTTVVVVGPANAVLPVGQDTPEVRITNTGVGAADCYLAWEGTQ
jgi:hypothetical protein